MLPTMSAPKPKAPSKRVLARQRRMVIREAIHTAVDIASPAEMRLILDELLSAVSALGSVMRPARGRPTVVWASNATLSLIQAVTEYAEHLGRPVEEIALETIMRIGPHVDRPYRWN